MARQLLCIERDKSQLQRNEVAAMESFAPEFAHYWLNGQAAAAGDSKRERVEDDAIAQQAALEALADRVSAARSIV
jgi:hypothetical protein